MRATSYAFLLAAWALLAGCLGAPRAENWLAVGFRTPEQTFRTFQTGLRAEEPDLEYRCLGSDFKRRAGLDQLRYREFRRELIRSQPLLRLAAGAEIKSVQRLSEDRVRLCAEVDTWLGDEAFELELVREDFYELWVGERRVADDQADWRRIARERDDKLVVSVPLPDGLTVEGVGELRAGGEWKIDAFPLRADTDPRLP